MILHKGYCVLPAPRPRSRLSFKLFGLYSGEAGGALAIAVLVVLVVVLVAVHYR